MLRIGLFASALLLAACATAGEDAAGITADRECFRGESVTGFNVVDRNTVEVRVGASRRYLLTTNWPTTNLDFRERIGLRSSTGMICTGNGLGVDIIGGDPVQTYPIQSIARAPEPATQG
ncbi:MAG TPA: DUF6491 family protein [Candidatus Binatia bacterium]|nr:DUF6491 family protein [Candidatus Binatia bacterium]